jgi:exopolysaccharide biosynthesis polyprenyl glycosylphosphotransferase
MNTMAEASIATGNVDAAPAPHGLAEVLTDPARARRVIIGADAHALVRIVADAACNLAGAFVATVMVPQLQQSLTYGTLLILALLASAVGAGLSHVGQRHDHNIEVDVGPTVIHALVGVLLSILALGTAFWLALRIGAPEIKAFPLWLSVWVLSALLLLLVVRAGLRHLGMTSRVLLVGPPDACEALLRSEMPGGSAHACWNLVAVVDDATSEGVQRVVAAVENGEADFVIVTAPLNAADARTQLLRCKRICDDLGHQPVRVRLALPSTVGALANAGQARGFTWLDLHGPPQTGASGIAKRMTDVVISAVVLVMLLPLFGMIAAAIRLETTGPVFFKQWRFGLGSCPFRIIKFRTMHDASGDPTGAQRTRSFDPRVTRVGRFLRRTSLDELPQLLNVLVGDMSLIGPRPHPLHMRVGESYYFEAVDHYLARHLVRPGISGWAQINGSRGEIDTLEKARHRIELDRWYILNWSFVLDLRILLRTIFGGFASPNAD